MADAIERLYRLSVDATQAVSQITKLNTNVDKFASSLATIGKTIGGALALDYVVDKFSAVVDGMDDIVKASQRVGVSAENLQALRYAAEASGASADTLDKGLERLGANLQDVEAGTTDAARALKAFGVTSTDTTESAFAKISAGFAKLPDGAQKTAAAMNIFGKAGAELIPTLNAGADGLAAFSEEAQSLGLVLSTSTLKAAEAFNDQLDMLGNMSKASAQQFAAGLLPALQTITTALIDAKKGGDGFQSWGERVGDVLVDVAKFAILVATGFEKVGETLGAVAAGLADPFHARAIFDALGEELDRLNDKAAATMEDLDARLQKFKDGQKAFVGPPAPPTEPIAKLVIATGKLTEAQQHAADMMKVYTAAAAANATEDERAAKAADERAKSTKAVDDALHASARGQEEATKNAEDAFDTEQKRLALLDGYTKMLETGDEWQQKFAASQILLLDPPKKMADAIAQTTTEIDVLTDGFKHFFDNLAHGTADALDLFKSMVQSIIAELLKLWAQKYIIEFFFPKARATPAPASGTGGLFAAGGAFDAGRVIPFATGGVIGSPTLFRMAGRSLGLAGEAGPEAILPLQRTGDGALGVRGMVPAMNVAIHNHTDAAVSARRNNAGDLEVIIEQTRKAIAADFRRGGTDVARAAEAAYRLSRGAAAPF
jgi:hypothetical protein